MLLLLLLLFGRPTLCDPSLFCFFVFFFSLFCVCAVARGAVLRVSDQHGVVDADALRHADQTALGDHLEDGPVAVAQARRKSVTWWNTRSTAVRGQRVFFWLTAAFCFRSPTNKQNQHGNDKKSAVAYLAKQTGDNGVVESVHQQWLSFIYKVAFFVSFFFSFRCIRLWKLHDFFSVGGRTVPHQRHLLSESETTH